MKIFTGILTAGLLASTLYPCQTQASPPLAPSNLAAVSMSSTQLAVVWRDNATNETSFELQYGTNASFTTNTVTRNLPLNSQASIVSGLDPLTTRYFRVRTIGTDGVSTWSNTAGATTRPGAVAATEVPSSGVNVNTIKVDWTPNPANKDITGYTVRYSTAAGACTDRAVAGINSSTYLATGLVPSKTYQVSLKAEGKYPSAFSAPAVVAATSPDGLKGTRISPLFFGQNAWMPLRIGAVDKNGDLEELLCGASYYSDLLCRQAEVHASGVKLMRYGGDTVDNHYDANESPAQYLTMVDNMRANGIEPLLEVPYGDGVYNATDAAALVRYINITHDRCVRYWTIANEPDRYTVHHSATDIATYFRDYAVAMRDVDPTIIIVGPDLSSYDDTIMNELTTPGGANDICGSYVGSDGNPHYYLDVLDFHDYHFSGLDPDTGLEDPEQTRPNVIAYPQDTSAGGFQGKIMAMKTRVDTCNSGHNRTGDSVLKMAVTEINIEYRNPADLSLSGVSAQSFLAGQYWADLMNVGMKNGLEFMTFWSVKEGNPQLGYIASDYTKLPTYYHYQMLAQDFRGVSVPAISSVKNVKVFSAKDVDQIVVLLLNEDKGTLPLTYSVRLDLAPIKTGALKVNIDAGVNRQYNSPLRGELAAESTVKLVFDASGNLRARYVYSASSASAPPTKYPN